jgi:hypothetical protein
LIFLQRHCVLIVGFIFCFSLTHVYIQYFIFWVSGKERTNTFKDLACSEVKVLDIVHGRRLAGYCIAGIDAAYWMAINVLLSESSSSISIVDTALACKSTKALSTPTLAPASGCVNDAPAALLVAPLSTVFPLLEAVAAASASNSMAPSIAITHDIARLFFRLNLISRLASAVHSDCVAVGLSAEEKKARLAWAFSVAMKFTVATVSGVRSPERNTIGSHVCQHRESQ